MAERPLDTAFTPAFRKDLKRRPRRGPDLSTLLAVLIPLVLRQQLEPARKDRALTGSYEGYREWRVAPDWLLIHRVVPGEGLLAAARTGAHADLFWPEGARPRAVAREVRQNARFAARLSGARSPRVGDVIEDRALRPAADADVGHCPQIIDTTERET
jgi:mRNA interferase YafQ